MTKQASKPLPRLRFRFGLYRVQGESMLPAYAPGDLLLGYRTRSFATGNVVVVRRERVLIKRIQMIENQSYYVVGDNPAASTDSRSFGLVPARELEAKILLRLARA